MTALIQIPNTPEFFAKVEKRLAKRIHEEAQARAEASKNELASLINMHGAIVSEAYLRCREWRGIRDALKANLPVHLDAETYWSLCNE